ncbi:unnamed protein product [Durusdinium trenchii]|uniref:Uncharacterized protein n=1 Tax=Durusdinium trenchii TaxID=1381693 RepID=A0ABP0NI96_9DINO
MANSPRMVLRYYLRVCLFFPMPGYAAIFWTDSYLLISLTLISLLAIPLHLFWMRHYLCKFNGSLGHWVCESVSKCFACCAKL